MDDISIGVGMRYVRTCGKEIKEIGIQTWLIDRDLPEKRTIPFLLFSCFRGKMHSLWLLELIIEKNNVYNNNNDKLIILFFII